MRQSKVHIDKQITSKPNNQEPDSVENKFSPPQKKSIEDRKLNFQNNMVDCLRNEKSIYLNEKEENRRFFEYWTEHGEFDKKMRFEKETSFSISRRLETWFMKANKFKPLVQKSRVQETVENMQSAYEKVKQKIAEEEIN